MPVVLLTCTERFSACLFQLQAVNHDCSSQCALQGFSGIAFRQARLKSDVGSSLSFFASYCEKRLFRAPDCWIRFLQRQEVLTSENISGANNACWAVGELSIKVRT